MILSYIILIAVQQSLASLALDKAASVCLEDGDMKKANTAGMIQSSLS